MRAKTIVRELVNLIWRELTLDLMQSNRVEDELLVVNRQTWYRKEESTGYYQSLYGEVAVSRNLYQTSAGGRVLCPLEINCQIRFGSATPLLAEVIGFKRPARRPERSKKTWPKARV
jgi:hypothetical protein